MFYWALVYTFLSLTVYPVLLFLLFAVVLLVSLVVHFGLRSAVDALRLDAISRSPINSLFSTTL